MRTLKTVKSFDVSPDGRTFYHDIYDYQIKGVKSLLYNVRREMPLLKSAVFIEIRGKLATSDIIIRQLGNTDYFVSHSPSGLYSSITIAEVGRGLVTKTGFSDRRHRLIESAVAQICRPCLPLISIEQIDYLRVDENAIVVGANGVKFIFSNNSSGLKESLRIPKSQVRKKR